MLIVLKQHVNDSCIERFLNVIRVDYGLRCKVIEKNNRRLIALLEEESKKIDINLFNNFDCVDYVNKSDELVNLVDRDSNEHSTVVSVGDYAFGRGNFCVMGGPCSIESEEQLWLIADKIKSVGVNFLRGGAFKPRTSPYSFQGLGKKGIELLLNVKRLTGLCVVTELVDLKYLDLFSDVDIIQVGARNMQNFEMLRQLGKCDKPILLKRGISSTIHEWLMSAEYILSGGNKNVILCERGIRTYETFTRNTLDISAVSIIKKISHLPIIVDPSHAAGIKWLVEPLTKAAIAAGADGVMVEVHNCPAEALSDGKQSLNLDEFDDFMQNIKPFINVSNKKIL